MYDRLRRLIIMQSAENEAGHLKLYLPGLREPDPEVQLLEPTSSRNLSPDQVAHSTPETVAVYESTFTRSRGEGMQLNAFAMGAASACIFIDVDQGDLAAELINQTLEVAEEMKIYPRLDRVLSSRYVTAAVAALDNGETVNREQLLAYNYGVWWLLGHVRDIHELPYEGSTWLGLKRGRYMVEWLEEVMTDRASRAILEEY